MAGLRKPQRGQVTVSGSLGMLPQNPQTLFVKKTVREDLFEIFAGTGLSREEQERRVARMVGLCRLEELLDRHPYDLSGGEQQRAALGKVLLLGPEVLLLDEPTKGLDAEYKQTLAQILQQLLAGGVSLLMVSHDVDRICSYVSTLYCLEEGTLAELTPGQVRRERAGLHRHSDMTRERRGERNVHL